VGKSVPMSRTHHHSLHHGRDHRFASTTEGACRADRGYGFSRRGVGEAPGWHVRLYDTKPARHADATIAHEIVKGTIDPDGIAWAGSANRAPHSYYW
jgi:hypothetical protein